MFIEYVLASFFVGFLRGGRLQPAIPFRWAWLAPASFLIHQVNPYILPHAWQPVLTITGFGIMLAFLGANLENQGLRLVLVGVLLNLLVILANGGRIPVDTAVASRLGLEVSDLATASSPRHTILTDDSGLGFLGDVLSVRFPIARVFSIGDIFVVCGGFLVIQELMGKRIFLFPTTARGSAEGR